MKKTKIFNSVLCICMSLCLSIGGLAVGMDAIYAADYDTTGKALAKVDITAAVDKTTSYAETYDQGFYNDINTNYDTYTDEATALQITNAGELAAFAKAVNDGKDFEGKFVELTDDIDLKGTAPVISYSDAGSGKYKMTIGGKVKNAWDPIGENHANSFKGTFDGKDKVITGMVVLEKHTGEYGYSGLFGYVRGAVIKNVGINGGSVTSFSSVDSLLYAGSLVGFNGKEGSKGSIITNSYGTGAVTSSSVAMGVRAGGLVGSNSEGDITNSYGTGTVTSWSKAYGAMAGGLVGDNSEGDITNSYGTGDATASSTDSISYAGGLVGSNSKGDITNSYGTGDATTSSTDSISHAGGLVGSNSKGDITNSYGTGDATAFSTDSISYAGGLVGANSEGDIKNSYATGDATAISTNYYSYAGGLVGNNGIGSITNCYRNSEATIRSQKGKSAGTITNEGTALSPKEMTGSDGAGRAKEKMVGFEEPIWTFTVDDPAVGAPGNESSQTLYYPRLDASMYPSGNFPAYEMRRLRDCVEAAISGTIADGSVLTAEVTDKAGAPNRIHKDKLEYQWYVDGKAISGATGETYKVQSAKEVKKRIKVVVTHPYFFGKLEAEIRKADPQPIDKDTTNDNTTSTKTSEKVHSGVQTGDDSNLLPWLIALVLSGGGSVLTVLVLTNRRKKNEKQHR